MTEPDYVTRLRDTECSTRLCGGMLPNVFLADLQAILAERDKLREEALGYRLIAVNANWNWNLARAYPEEEYRRHLQDHVDACLPSAVARIQRESSPALITKEQADG